MKSVIIITKFEMDEIPLAQLTGLKLFRKPPTVNLLQSGQWPSISFQVFSNKLICNLLLVKCTLAEAKDLLYSII